MRRCRIPVPAVIVIIAAYLGCIFPPVFRPQGPSGAHSPGDGIRDCHNGPAYSGGYSQPVLLLIPIGGLADTHIQRKLQER